eukprot:Sspe_Gene.87737::Locus_59510_Transcript_1_1_Confidence_1.000_Length_1091::g.87737::m.87737
MFRHYLPLRWWWGEEGWVEPMRRAVWAVRPQLRYASQSTPPPPPSGGTSDGSEKTPDPLLELIKGVNDAQLPSDKPTDGLKRLAVNLNPPLPDPITESPADAWQPPRLRSHKPARTYKYQYRGGIWHILDGMYKPLGFVLLIFLVIKARNAYRDWRYGEPDFSILEQYHAWDNKRPGQWPPQKKTTPGPFGIQHEVMS